MKHLIRDIVDGVIEGAKEQGLDLVTDSLEMSFTYPDIPTIQIYIRIGGMFQGIPEGEEH